MPTGRSLWSAYIYTAPGCFDGEMSILLRRSYAALNKILLEDFGAREGRQVSLASGRLDPVRGRDSRSALAPFRDLVEGDLVRDLI